VTRAAFDRLSALDALFLAIEDDANLMHVALTGTFERAPLLGEDGKIDRTRIRAHLLSVLQGVPKFRRRLERVPVVRHPVLVEDPTFDVDEHLHFVELESGSEAELKGLVGRIYSEPLDRARPLWDMWLVDGVEGERVAVVTKAHHCLVDGIAGIAAITAMLRPTPETGFDAAPLAETLAPPTRGDLLHAELGRLGADVKATFLQVTRGAREHGALAMLRRAGQRARALGGGVSFALGQVYRPASKTSLNPAHVGAYRSFEWLSTELADAKAIARASGAKVNDVVLAVVAAALRQFLLRRGEACGALDVRALVPVSTHLPGDASDNRVSVLIVPLPVSVSDPAARLALVSKVTAEAKASGESQALAAGEKLADLTFFNLVTVSARVAIRFRPYNVIVTNVPGPSIPLFFQGARLLGAYPMVPLYGNNAVGFAVLSYDGKLHFGINADAERVPDLAVLADDVRTSFAELRRAVLG
jgi:diacylglycerol O-acyltransferase / wax synthase